ncbi:DUF4363 family protein [Alkalicoccobacillus gibsonii]|uniref:DUF4363 family protein n=1 Tax=Alkalicoccobacillus gibsonii TaxID=79881 RepID=A0ABU9VEX8_9BACI
MVRRKMIVSLMMITLLTACGNVVGSHAFYVVLDHIEEALEQSDWDQLDQYASQFEETYAQNKWKLQLIGDEGEYEGLYESIQKLIAGVKEKDSTIVRLELASARALVSDIYSL